MSQLQATDRSAQSYYNHIDKASRLFIFNDEPPKVTQNMVGRMITLLWRFRRCSNREASLYLMGKISGMLLAGITSGCLSDEHYHSFCFISEEIRAAKNLSHPC